MGIAQKPTSSAPSRNHDNLDCLGIRYGQIYHLVGSMDCLHTSSPLLISWGVAKEGRPLDKYVKHDMVSWMPEGDTIQTSQVVQTFQKIKKYNKTKSNIRSLLFIASLPPYLQFLKDSLNLFWCFFFVFFGGGIFWIVWIAWIGLVVDGGFPVQTDIPENTNDTCAWTPNKKVLNSSARLGNILNPLPWDRWLARTTCPRLCFQQP